MSENLNSFEKTIKKYLDEYAKNDQSFAKKYANENKSISECCKYIYQQVEKMAKKGERCVACDDNEVYGMAVHYYDEEDIHVDGPKNQVEKVEVPVEKTEEHEKAKKQRTRNKKEVEVDENMPESLVIPIF